MAAPYFAYGAVGLTGGDTSNLDAISSSAVNQNDIAVALDNDKIYFYKLEEESGKDESVPYVIKPDDASGDKRWELISQEVYTTNIIQLLENYIQTSHIKALEDNALEIESADGYKITLNTDGSIVFPSFATSSPAPTADDHLTNKEYVDNEIDSKESSLQDYLDTEMKSYIDSETESLSADLVDYTDNEIHTYVDSEVSDKETELKEYVDTEIENVYPMIRETITSWTASDDLYYADITHNKGYVAPIVRCWKDDEMIYPEKIESTDEDTIRVWMTIDEDLTVTIM